VRDCSHVLPPLPIACPLARPSTGTCRERSVWLERKAARLDLEKKQERKRAKAMEEELAWIRQGAKVRQTN
jgi:hypothetical protein